MINNAKGSKFCFELDEKETAAALAFIKEHSEVCCRSYEKGNMPAAGEHFMFSFIPHGLGVSKSIKCLYCKDAHKDITNTDNW